MNKTTKFILGNLVYSVVSLIALNISLWAFNLIIKLGEGVVPGIQNFNDAFVPIFAYGIAGNLLAETVTKKNYGINFTYGVYFTTIFLLILTISPLLIHKGKNLSYLVIGINFISVFAYVIASLKGLRSNEEKV